MSKTIEITSCEECPHLVFMGSCTKKDQFCALFAKQEGETKDGKGEFNENNPIPTWCPLPDSKEQGWQDIETAPKGGWAELVTAPEWAEPPLILLLFQNGKQVVCCWDWYYAESGHGYQEGLTAWVEPTSGEQIALIYGNPIGWMPLPSPPTEDKP